MTARRSPGEGTVFQNKSRPGQWVVEVSLGSQDDGKRTRVRRYASTKSQALAIKRILLSEARMQAAKVATLRAVSLRMALAHYIGHETEGLKRRTRAWVQWMVLHHLPDALLDAPVASLTPVQLDGWLTDLAAKGYSHSTRVQARKTLNLVLRDAVRREVMASNPLDRTRRLTRTADQEVDPDRVYSKEQVLDLESHLSGSQIEPVVRMAVRLGLRRGEVLGLRWSDVDLTSAAPRVHVRRSLAAVTGLRTPERARIDIGTVKTRQSRRSLSLSAELVRTLIAVQSEQASAQARAAGTWFNTDRYIFTDPHGLPLDPGWVSKSFQRELSRTSLPRVRFHDLRHTAACLMLEAEVPLEEVTQMLGHTSTDFTKRYYARYVQALADRAVHALSNLLSDAAQVRARDQASV